jgi:thiol-disulfide isomerase/thioredoxin
MQITGKIDAQLNGKIISNISNGGPTMYLQPPKPVLLLFSFITVLFGTSLSSAQELSRVTIPLGINDQQGAFAGLQIKFGDNRESDPRLGKAPGEVLVAVEKSSDPKFIYQIKVDSDGDGGFEGEPAQNISPNSPIVVWVDRRWKDGERRRLPYTINYSTYIDKANEKRESFLWVARYRLEGKIKAHGCETLLVAVDLNGDGVFDQRDFSMGTSIGLDRNGDGQIKGKDEWLKGEQIIEVCGTSLLIESLDPGGTVVTLVESTIRVPKVGEPLPVFAFTTSDGKAVDSNQLRGKIHLLDFWASWCGPCVKKFPSVKQLDKEFGDALKTIAINVDDQSHLEEARQVVKDYQLTWPHVMNGKGEADPIWKMFGGMGDNRLAIPLYVLVDQQGRLRYAGNGADDLSEIRELIKRLIQAK